jgi:hypothetical protein
MAPSRPDRYARAAALAAMLVAATLLIAACGGGSKNKHAGISHADYVARVDALCKRVARQSKPINEQLQALVDGSGTFKSRLLRAAPLLHRTYAIQSSKLKRFKRIASPPNDRADVHAIEVVAAGALKDLHDGLPAADSGDLADFIDVALDATGNRAKVERLGTQYGFRSDCFTVPIKLG